MPATRERDETFTVFDGHLVRTVAPARGKPYEHRCPRERSFHLRLKADEAVRTRREAERRRSK